MYNGLYVYRINFHYSFSTAVFQHSDAKRHVVSYSCRSRQVHATLALPAVTDRPVVPHLLGVPNVSVEAGQAQQE